MKIISQYFNQQIIILQHLHFLLIIHLLSLKYILYIRLLYCQVSRFLERFRKFVFEAHIQFGRRFVCCLSRWRESRWHVSNHVAGQIISRCLPTSFNLPRYYETSSNYIVKAYINVYLFKHNMYTCKCRSFCLFMYTRG